MTERLVPGATIGILGGGQLGRMLSLAAARLGLRTHVFDPVSGGPAEQVSATATIAGYDDVAALTAFANAVDVVTYEFENIPTAALDAIEAIVPIRPDRRALSVSQDRVDEKRFLNDLGLLTAPYRDVPDAAALKAALGQIGRPAILKSRRFGYDGKGQVRIAPDSDPDAAYAEMNGAPAVLEGMVAFEREVSVIAARGIDGAIACFDPGENEHRDGILHRTTVPASISRKLTTDAVLLASRILNALDYVGVMGIELFVTQNQLLVNEIAPRVHNSGHWTQNACVVDQFEQHIRAVAGWPLSRAERHSNAEMINLIGDDVAEYAQVNDDGLHLYGKAETRAGRKMGHINRITPKG